jgi:ribonuclease HI
MNQNEDHTLSVCSSDTQIYCDGSCEPNPGKMWIGVQCECPKIAMTQEVGLGTNNMAECLAAIIALEEAKRLSLSGFTLFSDSLLVCKWTSAAYKCRSATAQQYVPTIRQLLAERGATIKWCPGKRNPADAMSRRPVDQTLTQSPPEGLVRIVKTPMESLRFRDFASLKVGGRDQFSRIPLDRLKELVRDHSVVSEAIQDESATASCLRWMLRGLPLDKAIRKVRTDLEVAENAKAVKHED